MPFPLRTGRKLREHAALGWCASDRVPRVTILDEGAKYYKLHLKIGWGELALDDSPTVIELACKRGAQAWRGEQEGERVGR